MSRESILGYYQCPFLYQRKVLKYITVEVFVNEVCLCLRPQEYRTRLDKVDAVHRELRSHVQSLPDLTLLPDVTGGLKPLPSAGDLFSSADKE